MLALRLLLAAVFAVAGAAKLRDADGSRGALEDFGVPSRLAGPGGVLLPLAEIAIAVGLLFPPSARWAALAAVVLLAAFVGAIANALAHGRTPDCHCFGQLHSEPAGRSTLARNVVLIAVAAAVAVFGPGPAVHSWIAERSAGELAVLAVSLAAAALAAYQLAEWSRRRARRRKKEYAITQLAATYEPSGLPVGSPAPAFTLPGADGEPRTLESLCALGRPVVLVFVHPDCIPCRLLLPRVAEWRSRLAADVTIAVISNGSVEDNESLLNEHGIDDYLLQQNGETYIAYELRQGTPSAVVVDPHRRIASSGVAGEFAIEELIRLTLRRDQPLAEPSLSR